MEKFINKTPSKVYSGIKKVKDTSEISRTMTIEIILPKIIYNFIMGYCKMSGLEPDEFMFAAIMHSMDQLMEEKNGSILNYIR